MIVVLALDLTFLTNEIAAMLVGTSNLPHYATARRP